MRNILQPILQRILSHHEASYFYEKREKVKYKIRELTCGTTIEIEILVSVNGEADQSFYKVSDASGYSTLDKMWGRLIEDLLFHHALDNLYEKWKSIQSTEIR